MAESSVSVSSAVRLPIIAIIRIIQTIPNLVWLFFAYLLLADGIENELFWLWEVPVSTGTLLILVGVFLLMLEISKSTGFTGVAIFELLLSIVIAFVYYSFLRNNGECQTPTFLILTALQFLDVGTGAVVMVKVARRDIGIAPGGFGG